MDISLLDGRTVEVSRSLCGCHLYANLKGGEGVYSDFVTLDLRPLCQSMANVLLKQTNS